MRLSAAAVAKTINGRIHGRKAFLVHGIAPPDEAKRNDLTFVFDDKTETRAGVVISTSVAPGKISIVVKDTKAALYKLLRTLSKKPVAYMIASSAIIEKGARLPRAIKVGPGAIIKKDTSIGMYTRIGANCYIGRNVTIGNNCDVSANCVIFDETRIGDHVVINSGTVIGSPGFGFLKRRAYHRIPHIGTVKIDDYVEIGANCTIDRATLGKTHVGEGTKIDNLVHIAHNVSIGRHCLIMGQSGIAGSSRIGNNVVLCGQVGISDHVAIGDNAVVLAKSAVFKSIPKNMKVSGIPARRHEAVLRALARLYH